MELYQRINMLNLNPKSYLWLELDGFADEFDLLASFVFLLNGDFQQDVSHDVSVKFL